jgi:hypothetical protein
MQKGQNGRFDIFIICHVRRAIKVEAYHSVPSMLARSLKQDVCRKDKMVASGLLRGAVADRPLLHEFFSSHTVLEYCMYLRAWLASYSNEADRCEPDRRGLAYNACQSSLLVPTDSLQPRQSSDRECLFALATKANISMGCGGSKDTTSVCSLVRWLV